jgi:hypothetical protein
MFFEFTENNYCIAKKYKQLYNQKKDLRRRRSVMREDVLKIMNDEKERNKFLRFLFEDDLFLYKDILDELSVEDQLEFIKNETELMQEDCDGMYFSNALYSKNLKYIKDGIEKSKEFREILCIPIRKADINILKSRL